MLPGSLAQCEGTTVAAPDLKQRCFRRVLDVFPDLSHRHLGMVYDLLWMPNLPIDSLCIMIIEQIMSRSKYPKQKDDVAQAQREELDKQRSKVTQAQQTLDNNRRLRSTLL